MRLRIALRVLAILEVVGGAIGLIGLLIVLALAGATVNSLVSVAVGTPFFLLAIFGGVRLWQERPGGYFASIAVQLPQVIKIATSQFTFMLGVGGDISITRITLPPPEGKTIMSLHTQGGSFSVIEIHRPDNAPLVFGVSILPCVALALLIRAGQSAAKPGTLPDRPAESVIPDGQPAWAMPFWMQVALGLFLLLTFCCCAGNLIPVPKRG